MTHLYLWTTSSVKMGKAFAEYIEGYEFDVGYIEPRHGMKGKLTPLRSDSDLAAMHTDLEFKRKKRILFRAGGTGPVAPVLAGPFFNDNSTNYLVHFLSFTFGRCRVQNC